MSEIRRSGPVFNPSAELRASPVSREGRPPAASQKLAGWLMIIPTVATIAHFLAFWIPESRALPFTSFLVAQVAPLVPPLVGSAGYILDPVQAGLGGTLSSVILAAGWVARSASRSAHTIVHMALVPAVVIAGVASLVQLLLCVPAAARSGSGLLLLGVMVVLALQAARMSLGVNPGAVTTRRTGSLKPIVIAGLSVVGPIALGRCLFGSSLRTAAATLPTSLAGAALLDLASVYLWLAGMAMAAIVWGAWQLIPPWHGRQLIAPILALVVGVGPGFAYAVPEAQNRAALRASELATGSPSNSIPSLCSAWWRKSTPQRTLAVSGPDCRTVTLFSGYTLVATREAEVRLGNLSVTRPDGASIASNGATALYGSVFVTAASTQNRSTPDALVGVHFETGKEVWRWTCAEPPLSVRLAGTGHDDPNSARQTQKGEGERAFVACADGKVSGLNPATGRP